MTKAIRCALILIGATQCVIAVAFFLQWPMAKALWPFPGTTPLTFIFVSSIFAAAAASTLWAAGSGTDGALAGIGLDYFAILTPVSILELQMAASGSDSHMIGYAIGCALGALFGLCLFGWSVRIPIDTTVPMPRLVRWSFVVFVLALLIVSTRLIMNVPTLPWKTTPDLSLVIGWMFIGAAAYFAYALLRPSWLNSAGQLIGFLAYDVVLIVPFLSRLPGVAPEHRVGLIVYTLVVVYSGVLAIYFLFLHRGTRLWDRMGSARG